MLPFSHSCKKAARHLCKILYARTTRLCDDAQLHRSSVCTFGSTSSVSIGWPPDVGSHTIYILAPPFLDSAMLSTLGCSGSVPCAKHHLSCQGIIVIRPSPSLHHILPSSPHFCLSHSLHPLVHLQNPLHPSLFCCLSSSSSVFAHTHLFTSAICFSVNFYSFIFFFRKLHCNFYLFIDVKFCTF